MRSVHIVLSFILVFISTVSFSQHTERINEIRSIYKSHNETLRTYEPSYSVSFLNENEGYFTSDIKVYSDYEGQALVIVEEGADGYGRTLEYYFEKGEIAFIFSDRTNYFSHVSSQYKIDQIRVYFDEGEIFKLLQKEYTGEGNSAEAELSKLPNKELSFSEISLNQYEYEFKNLVSRIESLVKSLDDYFMK